MKISIDKKQWQKLSTTLQRNEMLRLVTLMFATRMQELISPYPPATEANRAAPGKSHYVRGLGSVYTRKTTKAKGRGRKGKTMTVSKKGSEMLGRKWDIVEGSNRAVLRNTASYAGYVHDARYQAAFHGNRGWKTDEEALRTIEDGGEIDEFVAIALQRIGVD